MICCRAGLAGFTSAAVLHEDLPGEVVMEVLEYLRVPHVLNFTRAVLVSFACDALGMLNACIVVFSVPQYVYNIIYTSMQHDCMYLGRQVQVDRQKDGWAGDFSVGICLTSL